MDGRVEELKVVGAKGRGESDVKISNRASWWLSMFQNGTRAARKGKWQPLALEIFSTGFVGDASHCRSCTLLSPELMHMYVRDSAANRLGSDESLGKEKRGSKDHWFV